MEEKEKKKTESITVERDEKKPTQAGDIMMERRSDQSGYVIKNLNIESPHGISEVDLKGMTEKSDKPTRKKKD